MRLKIDRCRAYGPGSERNQEDSRAVVVSLQPHRYLGRLPRACGAGSRAVRYLPSPGPAACRHSRRRAGRSERGRCPRAFASTGSRKNFARPTAGSRNCRTRSISSRRSCRSSARTLNSGSAIAPAAPPPDSDVAEAPWPRPAGRRLRGPEVGRVRSQRGSERAGRAAPVGDDAAERAARS